MQKEFEEQTPDMSVEMENFSASLAVARDFWRAHKDLVEANMNALPQVLQPVMEYMGHTDTSLPDELTQG